MSFLPRPLLRRPRSLLRILLGLAVMAVPAFLAAPAAQADMGCGSSPLSQPFLSWGDPSQYELAPGGDFESSAWTLAGGAAQVPGSDPYALTGTLGSSSLGLPQGATAESPPVS